MARVRIVRFVGLPQVGRVVRLLERLSVRTGSGLFLAALRHRGRCLTLK